MASPTILVTGANTGLGLAVSKQLVKEYGARVFLGSRNPLKGLKAIEEVKVFAGVDNSSVELVTIDVESDASVQLAAKKMRDNNVKLNAIVNNAGRGVTQGPTTPKEILNVNLFGPKRVVDAFLPLLEDKGSRIVNTGSDAGPFYVSKQKDPALVELLCSPDITWDQIVELSITGLATDTSKGYGLSKALLAGYTRSLANEQPAIGCFCASPGFVDTAMTAGFGATKTPEEGTVSLLHCLLEAPIEQSGYFFGSNAKPAPLDYVPNPERRYPWDADYFACAQTPSPGGALVDVAW